MYKKMQFGYLHSYSICNALQVLYSAANQVCMPASKFHHSEPFCDNLSVLSPPVFLININE